MSVRYEREYLAMVWKVLHTITGVQQFSVDEESFTLFWECLSSEEVKFEELEILLVSFLLASSFHESETLNTDQESIFKKVSHRASLMLGHMRSCCGDTSLKTCYYNISATQLLNFHFFVRMVCEHFSI